MVPPQLRRLGSGDAPQLRSLNAVFADAFLDAESYAAEPPSDEYLESLLGRAHVVVLVALVEQDVVGGLVAYELDKLERARRELYIYDLAVAEPHRRRGIATALIEHALEIAAMRGASTVYVQAHRDDEPAIALYDKLGARSDVLHFDFDVPRAR